MDPQIIQQHGLTPQEYQKILKILGREPNLVELGIFSVMWSEHCSYKSSKVYLKKLPTRGKRVVCGPGENAGVVDIGDGLVVVFKMESHNHPSFIEPYQGAATGVGGILRDVFTMGARPIALLNSLRFGSPSHPRTPYLVNGVVAGIAGYGNCMGIPTVGGEVSFDECYNGNILVNAMCVGVAPKNRIFYARAAGPGNPVIYVGAKTGRDGIHGATMASDVFHIGGNAAPSASGGCGPHPPEPLSLEPAQPDSRSPESDLDLKRPTVQVGDPFTEKLLMEACLELMRGKDVVGIQDMGAAGLTCSSLEMAGKGRVGIDLDLSQVPLREEGMTAYEIMLSESQERMFLVGRRGSEKRILKLFGKWDLDAAVVGRVVKGNRVTIRRNGQLEGTLPTLPISEKAPCYRRAVKRPGYLERARHLPSPAEMVTATSPLSHVRERGPDTVKTVQGEGAYNDILKKLLASPNIASKKWVFRQYDHMVGTNTVILPGSDAAVVRLKDPHVEGRWLKKGLAMTVDGNGRYCYLDPGVGGRLAVAEAARNLVCSGARPLAVTDCLNFGSPENPEVMWQFKEAVLGIAAACRALGTPVVSGNVSFYNESRGGPVWPPNSGQTHGSAPTTAIYPTPTIGMVGLLDDIDRHCTQWFKEEGDVIVLVGARSPRPGAETPPLRDLGGSEYLKVIHGLVAGRPPAIDLKKEKTVQSVCLEGIRKGWIRSAHDCSEGGLAVALAECCISGPRVLGADVDVVGANPRVRPDQGRHMGLPLHNIVLLFAETQSRIIVTVREKEWPAFLKMAQARRCPTAILGTVGGERLRINGWIDIPLRELESPWKKGFDECTSATHRVGDDQTGRV